MCTLFSLQDIKTVTAQIYPIIARAAGRQPENASNTNKVITSTSEYQVQSSNHEYHQREERHQGLAGPSPGPGVLWCDVKIVATDGEIAANKTILGMRSPYFRCIFSSNNNFLESQAGSVKLPYAKSVLEKVIIFLYSGELKFDDLDLKPVLDLMELLKLLNLPMEFSTVESFAMGNIKKGKFSFSVPSWGWIVWGKLCWSSSEETLSRSHKWKKWEGCLRPWWEDFSRRKGKRRARPFSGWIFSPHGSHSTWWTLRLVYNYLFREKSSMISMLRWKKRFSKLWILIISPPSSSVQRSGSLDSYQADKIIERMEQLFELQHREFETFRAKEKETRRAKDQLIADVQTVKNRTTFQWRENFPESVKSRYSNL